VVRSFRRGALAAVLVLSLAPLAACASGNDSQTLGIHPDSQATAKGDIKVQNAYVLTQAGGPATVSARLFNNGSADQTLDSVRIAGTLTASLSDPNGGQTVTVPAHGSVLLGGTGNPSAVLDTGSESLRDGDVQSAVFTFSSTGQVALPVNVTPATGYLEPYGPSSLPTTAPPYPTATTPTATPGGTSAKPGGASAKPGSTAGRTDTAVVSQ
jgi:hypothetical protein